MATAVSEQTKKKVRDKLLELADRSRQIEELLLDPDVMNDAARYREITREHGELKKFSERHDEFEQLGERRKEAEELLSEPQQDPGIVELADQEIRECSAREEQLIEEALSMLVEQEGQTNRSVIVEIRAGTGGEEAALFAADLFRMYSRYAEKMGWQVEQLDHSVTDMGGLREVVFSVSGPGAWQKLRYESGGHRVQRVPVTESQGRIHTSLATVAVMPEVRELEVEIDPDELEISFMRSSGPGGQNVNKVSSCVRIVHKPTGISVRCQDEKSQHKNRKKAMTVLRARLYEKYESEKRQQEDALRKSLVGSGDRNERIRTYNFPQDRITDHRIGLDAFGIESVLMGDCGRICDALAEYDRQQRIKAFSES